MDSPHPDLIPLEKNRIKPKLLKNNRIWITRDPTFFNFSL